jgi:hypothetical protein
MERFVAILRQNMIAALEDKTSWGRNQLLQTYDVMTQRALAQFYDDLYDVYLEDTAQIEFSKEEKEEKLSKEAADNEKRKQTIIEQGKSEGEAPFETEAKSENNEEVKTDRKQIEFDF